MLNRYRLALAAAGLAALLGSIAAPASAATGTAATGTAPAGPTSAVAYQIGISHDGYSGDTSIVAPLTHRWSVNFAGPVSYPLIAGGKVFVTVASNSGYGTTLYALDKATGATIWSQPISGTYFWSNAAYDSGQVFVVNYDGLLRAFDANTGTLSWSVQLPGQYSFSSPPTANRGVVYVGGAGSGGTLYAVSETNGTVLWTQPVQNGDHSSPALDSTSVLVSYACGLTYAFNRTTGQQQWFSNGPCEGGGGKTAVYHGGMVYTRDFTGNKILAANTGNQLGTFQAGPAPAFDGNVGLFLNGGVLTASSGGQTVWTFSGDGSLDTAPIAVGNTVYVGSSSGMLYGLNVSNGSVVWSTNVGAGIPAPDEQNVSQPLTGLGAGQGLLVVPAGDELAAYGG
ncbi:MAG TPA: PQQ-binding-like beta-propeller repeat protein [Streptosporangiaceae bacterium]|jgi:outer membrane protein assembly factor BamB|nr:PQQ-binding-like beta-propeller repeat protein [Streptosporangiaceae bacterium]